MRRQANMLMWVVVFLLFAASAIASGMFLLARTVALQAFLSERCRHKINCVVEMDKGDLYMGAGLFLGGIFGFLIVGGFAVMQRRRQRTRTG